MRKLLTLSAATIVVLILIFAGWGLFSWQDFFSAGPRAGIIALIFSGYVAALALGIDLDPMRRGTAQSRNQSWSLLAMTLASLFLLWFLPFADHRHILTLNSHSGMLWLGLILCSIGIAIRLAALVKLGKQFSAYVTLQNGHELISSGIYSVIRHPLYLSLLLAGPGFALVFDSALVFPVLLITIVFVASRIRQEECLLRSTFGTQFEQYKARTWALIPPIL